MDTKTELEVSLIERESSRREKGIFYVQITQIRREANGQYYLIAIEEIDQGSTVTYDINLDDYWIKSICTYPDGEWKDKEEVYTETLEDLNDAIETIETYLEYDRPDDKEEIVTEGPRRIEVLFQRNMDDTKQERAIIHRIIPKHNKLDFYTVSGRVWNIVGEDLKESIYHFNINLYWIIKIYLFTEGTIEATSISKYKKSNVKQSWNFLKNSYNDFKDTELETIKNWTEKINISKSTRLTQIGYPGINGTYPGIETVHYYNRVPTHYQPNVGCFRVSGDEVGITLHRQQEKIKSRGPQSLEELIDIEATLQIETQVQEEEGEKKKPVPTIRSTTKSRNWNASMEASGQVIDGTFDIKGIETVRQISEYASSINVEYCDCGGPECENCLWRQTLEEKDEKEDNLKVIH